MGEVLDKAVAAKKAALKLANASTKLKNKALEEMASSIWAKRVQILDAGSIDVNHAQKLVDNGELSKPLLDRLKMNESKILDVVKMINSVALLEDPVGRTVSAIELDKGLELYKVTCPIGVIGAVFESRPDVLPQISSLCLKSGNSVILKGGKEAKNSNAILYEIINQSSEASGIPTGWIQLLDARKDVEELLKLDKYIDLLVPRGSNEFVKYIQDNSRIPILGHSAGICHVYVDGEANLDMALEVCFDAKVQYPAACNAMECLLIHKDIASKFLPKIAEKYFKAGVEILGCDRTVKILQGLNVSRAMEEDWGKEYLDLKVAVKIVDDVEDAINYINTYGSKHTDAIITSNPNIAKRFLEGVDSSSVIYNASTRFSDGYRYGLGAEVGISTTKIHARGPVGLEGLISSKYYVIGSGHVVSKYLGPQAKSFTHIKLAKNWTENLSD